MNRIQGPSRISTTVPVAPAPVAASTSIASRNPRRGSATIKLKQDTAKNAAKAPGKPKATGKATAKAPKPPKTVKAAPTAATTTTAVQMTAEELRAFKAFQKQQQAIKTQQAQAETVQKLAEVTQDDPELAAALAEVGVGEDEDDLSNPHLHLTDGQQDDTQHEDPQDLIEETPVEPVRTAARKPVTGQPVIAPTTNDPRLDSPKPDDPALFVRMVNRSGLVVPVIPSQVAARLMDSYTFIQDEPCVPRVEGDLNKPTAAENQPKYRPYPRFLERPATIKDAYIYWLDQMIADRPKHRTNRFLSWGWMGIVKKLVTNPDVIGQV